MKESLEGKAVYTSSRSSSDVWHETLHLNQNVCSYAMSYHMKCFDVWTVGERLDEMACHSDVFSASHSQLCLRDGLQ